MEWKAIQKQEIGILLCNRYLDLDISQELLELKRVLILALDLPGMQKHISKMFKLALSAEYLTFLLC